MVLLLALLLGCATRPTTTDRPKTLTGPAESKESPGTVGVIRVAVGGNVTWPGEYSLPAGSLVWDALQAAGGLSIYADPRNPVVLHRLQGQERRLIRLRQWRRLDSLSGQERIWYQEAGQRGQFEEATVLQNGDALYAVRQQ